MRSNHIYIYILINLRNNLILEKVTAKNLPDATRNEFNDVGGVSIKVERDDKYNWSYSGQLNQEYKQFAPAMNMTEYKWYMDLITMFKKACEAFNITYVLEGGPVLSAHRYHGFVPWDDDFDCKVNVSQKDILKKALNDIPGHSVLTPTHYQWKLFSNTVGIASPYG